MPLWHSGSSEDSLFREVTWLSTRMRSCSVAGSAASVFSTTTTKGLLLSSCAASCDDSAEEDAYEGCEGFLQT